MKNCLLLFVALMCCLAEHAALADPASAQQPGHYELLSKYIWNENFDLAIREGLKADVEIPGDFMTQYLLGVSFARVGAGKAAIEYFHRAALYSVPGSREQGFALDAPYEWGLIPIKPAHNAGAPMLTRQDAAHMYEKAKDFGSALNEYKATFEHEGRNEIVAFQIGMTYVQMGDALKAMEYFKKAEDLSFTTDAVFKKYCASAYEDFGLRPGDPNVHPNPDRQKKIGFGAIGMPSPPKENPPLIFVDKDFDFDSATVTALPLQPPGINVDVVPVPLQKADVIPAEQAKPELLAIPETLAKTSHTRPEGNAATALKDALNSINQDLKVHGTVVRRSENEGL